MANLTSVQRRALHAIDVTTRTGLAEPVTPLPDRLDGAGREALARIQAQAEIQVRGDREDRVIAERILPARDHEGVLVSNNGLLMLSEPSPGISSSISRATRSSAQTRSTVSTISSA